ncbi:hypothetical protein VTK56DRAFT_2153 [Thermocarpiscus australiensis]
MEAVLPRGFFENTREIYAEVASYPVVPPEKIRQYWNAYTTTFRRLVDPAAVRLENFWWHVWGSDRRYLSGPALARLFEEFSSGATIVPSSDRHGTDGPRPGLSQQPDQSSGQASAREGTKKTPSLSSSRPPPPHPILKKGRGPSASGPRPAPRFVSPPASDEEGVDEGEDPSTSNAAISSEMPPPPLPFSANQQQTIDPMATVPTSETRPRSPSAELKSPAVPVPAASGSDMPPTPTPPKENKSTAHAGRKIVATTATSRRRPVVLRRQSSTGCAPGPRVAGFATTTAAKHPGNKRPTLTAAQLLGQSSSAPQKSGPMMSPKPAKENRPVPPQTAGPSNEPVVVQQPQAMGPHRRSTWDVRDSVSSQEVRSQQEAIQPPPKVPPQAFPQVAGFVVGREIDAGPPPMLRSRSNIEGPHRREPGVALLPTQATSIVATSTTTARGQFDSEPVTSNPIVPEATDIPDNVLFAAHPSSSVLRDLRFKPTPPNPAPPIPFGRTRSELTLLLEREKARQGEGL